MRKKLLAAALAIATAAALPDASLVTAAHAQVQAPAASMVTPNRYGLPDFGDLVEQVGPAVVNIQVVQRSAQGTSGENPLANDPFYDFLRRFGVPEDLLGALLWLVNEEGAAFVTGTVIPVDGGFSSFSGV